MSNAEIMHTEAGNDVVNSCMGGGRRCFTRAAYRRGRSRAGCTSVFNEGKDGKITLIGRLERASTVDSMYGRVCDILNRRKISRFEMLR
jgi:hypothetical protein